MRRRIPSDESLGYPHAAPMGAAGCPTFGADHFFALETGAYPEAINLYAEGRLRVEGRRVRVLGAGGW